ncbi:unnamed protein product [Blumeria hordei]|nr:unnamed protein product [Blumeria hordei]
MSDDYKSILVEEASKNEDWEYFREKLLSARSVQKNGQMAKDPRYAIYDFHYQLTDGEGYRNKIVFLAWSPDDSGVKPKMVYASSKGSLKKSLDGIAYDFQLNDSEDIEYDSIVKNISRAKAGSSAP